MSRQILLTKGYSCIVDDEDYEWLNNWKWQAGIAKPGRVYARRSIRADGQIKQLAMHIAIAEKYDFRAPNGCIDHINCNTLDNRKANLRSVTKRENSLNRKPNSSSGYKGVWQRSDTGKWRARIRVNGKYITLGSFRTPEEAARAYNEAASSYFGTFAFLNEIHDFSDECQH